MRLHVIGSGCPVATAQRYGSAFALEMDSQLVLVDCGPATTHKMARMELDILRIGHVFLTHHHFDHHVDFPCLVLSRWDVSKGNEPPLEVYGPPPTERFVEQLVGDDGVFAPDLHSRVTHPASHACHRLRGGVMPRPGIRIAAHDVGDGVIAHTDSWQVTAATVAHVEPTLISLAYRFDTEWGSVVFAGDCADCEELRALARDADTLVITCTYFGAENMDKDIASVITGTREVIAVANATGVRRVVLTHASPRFLHPGETERAVAEIAREYQGAILFPDELSSIPIS